MIITHAATAGPDLLPAVAENNVALRQLIEGMLAHAITDGDLDPDADLPSLAIGIAGIMRGVLVQLMVDDSVTPNAAAEAAAALVDQALRHSLARA
ncbi:TetR family transcriptional regulator C-terminal domain-containing protein [Nocardioides sambongensis]|uniref:TetR family transcriptional regulator C-terminal domain-containing protein n=1 Tax=Nocardioides sambongensis TaxID=2589074 RepID=UPI0015E87739|nr:TetR family transcriptional regulator C-terminal domain-containing protein [Nocardioides sambongensis]